MHNNARRARFYINLKAKFIMKTAQQWVTLLQLMAHPEGGYYREMYRSAGSFSSRDASGQFPGDRSYATSIYFLLPSDHRSLFHRIKSDELWYYHAGCSLSIYVLQAGEMKILRLGPDFEKGERFQHVVPANCWFAAKPDQRESYTLSSCSVSPGFDFRDFEIAERQLLLDRYPHFKKEIEELTNA